MEKDAEKRAKMEELVIRNTKMTTWPCTAIKAKKNQSETDS